MPSPRDRMGSPVSGLDRLAAALDLARTWAGEGSLALIVGGSHAEGAAVWLPHAGRTVSISDLDLYAVVPDRRARRAACERARAGRVGLAGRLEAMGLAAPLEVGFHTPEDLASLPARPGTLDLRRRGRVLDGDPSWLDRVPAWTARDVSDEEVWLLLENRAFELLWAGHSTPHDPPIMGFRRRHAVLKCALELASVMALAAGEYPDDAAARVDWARPRWDRAAGPEPPWDEALAWREGRVVLLEPAAARAERQRTVAAWVAVWCRLAGEPQHPARPFAAVARVARRARWRRRLREALLPDASLSRPRLPGGRIRHAFDGTPRHRLHAAAAAHLILEALGAGADEEVRRQYRRVMLGLGVPCEGPDPAAALVRAWDRGLHDGQRTAGWS